MRSIGFFLLVFLVVGSPVMAQPSLLKLQAAVKNPAGVGRVIVNTKIPTQATIQLTDNIPAAVDNMPQWLSTIMNFRAGVDEFRFTGKKLKTKDNWHIHYLQQFYKGVPLQYGMASVLSYAGKAQLLQLELFPVPDNLDVRPVLSAGAAFDKAKLYLNAEKYVWDNYSGTDPSFLPPVATLTIIEHPKQKGEMVLCYKLRMAASRPMKYMDVYVSAVNGQIILSNDLGRQACNVQQPPKASAIREDIEIHKPVGSKPGIGQDSGYKKTALSNAIGNTRYSGQKEFITDEGSGIADKPFRLRAIGFRDRHDIITLDYGDRVNNFGNDAGSVDFVDNDNFWTEYADADMYTRNPTLSGIDVHFNMQVLSDYWANKQGRNSWNNEGAPVISYVNTQILIDNVPVRNNAAWISSRQAIYFGNGTYSRSSPEGKLAYTPLDICAHEFGHAVTSTLLASPDNTGFLTEGEPGALDEGFSDIWGACNVNYYNQLFDNGLQKDVWKHGIEHNPYSRPTRHLKEPKSSGQPDTYKGTNWQVGGYDRGGIHTNCTVLSKWFQLITDGGNGINDAGIAYNITAMGFDKSEQLVYKTEAMLLADADFETTRNVSIEAAELLVGTDIDHPLTAEDVAKVKEAWIAVGLGSDFTIYDIYNQPAVFTTNNFQSIAIGKDNQLWAGTNRNGLYSFDGSSWTKSTAAISDYNINDIKADKSGAIWIAESGRGDGNDQFSAGGGVYRFPGTSFSGYDFYGDANGLITRNVRSLFIDTTNTSIYIPPVWTANLPHFLPIPLNSTKRGGVCFGVNSNGFFTGMGAQMLDSTRGTSCIGGDKSEVWAYVKNNTNGPDSCQLLRYNALLFQYIGNYNPVNVPQLPTGFEANAIYADAKGNRWIGLRSGGMVTMDVNGSWHTINFPGIFPANASVKSNAIAGDADSVYIGTDSGLVVYNGLGLDVAANYRRLTLNDGLPSSKVNGICRDTLRGGLWLATDNGIAFMKMRDGRGINITRFDYDLCPGPGFFRLAFNTTGRFNGGTTANKFIVELSDEYGSFNDNPLNLLTINDAPVENQEYIRNIPIPPGLKNSLRYSVRVRATNPFVNAVFDNVVIYTKTFPSAGSNILRANFECEEGDWTHYYHANSENSYEILGSRLLSLKKNGNNLGTVDNGNGTLAVVVTTIAAAGTNQPAVVNNPGILNTYYSMNRYWEVNGAPQPLARRVGVRFYFTDQDIHDVNGGYPLNPVKPEQMVFYKAGGTDCNTNPASGFSNCSTLIGLIHETPTFSFPTLTWKHTDLGDGYHMAEFEVDSFSGGGGGITLGGGAFNNGLAVSIQSGNWSDPATWSTHLVPDQNTAVFVNHLVTVDINGECKTLKVATPGEIKVLTGKNLKVFK